MRSQEQKELFISWFNGLKWKGNPYKPVTIEGYTKRIESACMDPGFMDVSRENLFEITDLETLLSVWEEMKQCKAYEEYEIRTHHGLSAALKKYAEFLAIQSNTEWKAPVTAKKGTIKTTKGTNKNHRWTMAEDEACCKKYIDTFVVNQYDVDMQEFLKTLEVEVPNITEGSLRMKLQNIKYLALRAGIKDTCKLKPLNQCSKQCEKIFEKLLPSAK